MEKGAFTVRISFQPNGTEDLIAWLKIQQWSSLRFRRSIEIRYWHENDPPFDKYISKATRAAQHGSRQDIRNVGEKGDKITRENRGFVMSRYNRVVAIHEHPLVPRCYPQTTLARVYTVCMSSKFMQRSWLWYRIFLYTHTCTTEFTMGRLCIWRHYRVSCTPPFEVVFLIYFRINLIMLVSNA